MGVKFRCIRRISIQCKMSRDRLLASAFLWITNSQAEQISLAVIDFTHFKRKRSLKIDRATFCTEWKSAYKHLNNTVFIHPIPVILSRKYSVILQYIHTFAIASSLLYIELIALLCLLGSWIMQIQACGINSWLLQGEPFLKQAVGAVQAVGCNARYIIWYKL